MTTCVEEKQEASEAVPVRLPMRLLLETWVVGTIATLDCLSTIYLLHTGKAIEANPFLAAVAGWSLIAFFFVKMSFVIVPLLGLEHIRRMPGKDRMVKLMMRGGLAAYVIIYLGTMLLEFKFPNIARALHIIPSYLCPW